MAKETGDHPLWKEFVSRDTLFRDLLQLKEEGWANPAGDVLYEQRRQKASNRSYKNRAALYDMTCGVGKSLESAAQVLNLNTVTPKVLDLCMAPGGFSQVVREKYPRSRIDAITLSPEMGGYDVFNPKIFQDIIFADITMYASEMDLETAIPREHPDLDRFETSRPFLSHKYDLIFCGGAINKEQPREKYREEGERLRLITSQLVMAFNRLRGGGTLVLLLHRVGSWETACLLHAFSQFSDIQLFKPRTSHAIKSSFYMVAKNIQLEHVNAQAALSYWKDLWKYFTFKEYQAMTRPEVPGMFSNDDAFVCQLRDDFGPRFLELARPVAEIQFENLRKDIARWVR